MVEELSPCSPQQPCLYRSPVSSWKAQGKQYFSSMTDNSPPGLPLSPPQSPTRSVPRETHPVEEYESWPSYTIDVILDSLYAPTPLTKGTRLERDLPVPTSPNGPAGSELWTPPHRGGSPLPQRLDSHGAGGESRGDTVLPEEVCAGCKRGGLQGNKPLVLCETCLRWFHVCCRPLVVGNMGYDGDSTEVAQGRYYCSETCRRGEMPACLGPYLKAEEVEEQDCGLREKERLRQITSRFIREAAITGKGESASGRGAQRSAESQRDERSTEEEQMNAALRGVNFMYNLALERRNFVKVGPLCAADLFSLAQCSPEPLKESAMQRAEVLAKLLREHFRTLKELARFREEVDKGEAADADAEGEDAAGDGAGPDIDDVYSALQIVHALQRMGLAADDLASETRTFIEDHRLSVRAYVGFNPKKPEGNKEFRRRPAFCLARAIERLALAEHVGIDVGASVVELVELVQQQRPYQSRKEAERRKWENQLLMCTALVAVGSDTGELGMSSAILADEAALLADTETMQCGIDDDNPRLVGAVCRGLVICGVERDGYPLWEPAGGSSRDEALELLQRGRDFLVRQQQSDGSWGVRASNPQPYERYICAAAAVAGLCRSRPRGFGPYSAALAKALRRPQSHGQKKQKALQPSVVCCGSKRPLLVDRRFAELELLYRVSAGVELGGKADSSTVGTLKLGSVLVSHLLRPKLEAKAKQQLSELFDSVEASKNHPGGKAVPGQSNGPVSKSRQKETVMKAAAQLSRGEFARLFTAFQKQQNPKVETVELCLQYANAKIELYDLYQAVAGRGGRDQLPDLKDWLEHIVKHPRVNLPASMSERPRLTQQVYTRHLADWEEYWTQESQARRQREEVSRLLRSKIQEAEAVQRGLEKASVSKAPPPGLLLGLGGGGGLWSWSNGGCGSAEADGINGTSPGPTDSEPPPELFALSLSTSLAYYLHGHDTLLSSIGVPGGGDTTTH